MTTRREKELSQWLDGRLSSDRAARLEEQVASDAALRDSAEAWRQIGSLLRQETPELTQTPEAAWADVQRALRQAPAAGARPVAMPWNPRLAWSGGLIAALLVVAFSLFSLQISRTGPVAQAAAAQPAVEVEWVEVEWPDAMPMVYQDDDTGLTVIWMVELETKELLDADS